MYSPKPAIINTNQQLSIFKEGFDLMKGELSIKLVYFTQDVLQTILRVRYSLPYKCKYPKN